MGVLPGEHLRQEAQRVFHPDIALERQGLRVDMVDRAGAGQIGHVDAATGHHHLFQSHGRVVGFIPRRFSIRGKNRLRDGSQQQCHTHRAPSPQNNPIRHVHSLPNSSPHVRPLSKSGQNYIIIIT